MTARSSVSVAAAAGTSTAARRIVQRHGWSLGDYAVVAARRTGLGGEAFPLVLAGGVFRHPKRLLAGAITERVLRNCPRVQPVMSRFEPAVGALFLALRSAGAPIDAHLLCRAEESLPPAALFAT